MEGKRLSIVAFTQRRRELLYLKCSALTQRRRDLVYLKCSAFSQRRRELVCLLTSGIIVVLESLLYT